MSLNRSFRTTLGAGLLCFSFVDLAGNCVNTATGQTRTDRACLGEVRDFGLDTNENGLYDQLVIEAEFLIPEPGTYSFAPLLQTHKGEYLSTWMEEYVAESGWHTIRAGISAKDVHFHGEDGPYQIVRLTLSRRTPERVKDICEVADLSKSTAAYRVRQFERPPIQLTGEVSEFTTDSNHDGKLDTLTIRIGIDVVYPGEYNYQLTLEDSCQHRFVTQNASTELTGTIGEHIDITFKGSDIGANSMDGPFDLGDLIVWGPSGHRRRSTISPRLKHGKTEAYRAKAFDGYRPPPDCNKNGVHDLCDLTAGTSPDENHNFIPDECEDPEYVRDSGPRDLATIEQMISKATDPNEKFDRRWEAITALGQVTGDKDQATPVLVKLLHDPHPILQREALRALGALGPTAIDALPEVLLRLGAEQDSSMRHAAAEAVGGFGPAAKAAVPVLCEALKAQDPTLRGKAATALGEIGPAAAPAIPDLCALMHEEQGHNRYEIARSLGRILFAPNATLPEIPRPLQQAFNEGRRRGRVLQRERELLSAGAEVADEPSRIRVLVRSHEGQLVENARVAIYPVHKDDTWEQRRRSARFTSTDDLGTCYFRGVPEGTFGVLVSADGHATGYKELKVDRENHHVWIKLPLGRQIDITVVAPDGTPIEGAVIDLSNTALPLFYDKPIRTDSEGKFTLMIGSKSIPARIVKPEYMTHRFTLPATKGKDQVITLKRPFIISGTVTDAQTGQEILQFSVKLGMQMGEVPMFFDRYGSEPLGAFLDGHYEITFDESADMPEGFDKRILGIEATGYKRAVSRPFTDEEGDIVFDFKLTRQTGTTGVVRLPNGDPAAGAEVVISKRSDMWVLSLTQGELNHTAEQKIVVQTDETGRFEFPPQVDPYLIAVVHEGGFASISETEFASSPEITVQAWGRVEGIVRIGSRAAAGETVTLDLIESNQESRIEPARPGMEFTFTYREPDPLRVDFRYETTSDSDSRFVFSRVVPGRVEVARRISLGKPYIAHTHTVEVEVKPGQTTAVSVGGGGTTVLGRVELPSQMKDGHCSAHGMAQLKAVSGAGKPSARYPFPIRFEPDGSFRADDVPPGDYEVSMEIDCDDGIHDWSRVGIVEARLVVPKPDISQTDEPIDVGVLSIRPVNTLKPGTPAPSLALRGLDGSLARLSDYEGRVVLLHFTKIEWDPFGSQTDALRGIHETFGESDQFRLITVHLDPHVDRVRRFVKERDMRWRQFVPADLEAGDLTAEFGLHRRSNVFLLDADGRIVQGAPRLDKLKAVVEDALQDR